MSQPGPLVKDERGGLTGNPPGGALQKLCAAAWGSRFLRAIRRPETSPSRSQASDREGPHSPRVTGAPTQHQVASLRVRQTVQHLKILPALFALHPIQQRLLLALSCFGQKWCGLSFLSLKRWSRRSQCFSPQARSTCRIRRNLDAARVRATELPTSAPS